MKHIWSIASKELRSYFNSLVALIFIGAFLGVVLFAFFWVEKFFVRDLADIRPMFTWLPLLLVFLTSALTMRLWSEEQRLGTLEVLLTLPVPLHRLVLGKFLAGLILVAFALVLTLGIPITVSQMGDLDWGPVIGGYLGALLLASTYLAVGLCISAATEHQIVSLVFSAVACILLYLPGTDQVVGAVSGDLGDLLKQIGTGSRFESIARGVIDIRDIAYYASITALFLVVNTALLRAKRWSTGPRTYRQRFNVSLAVALCFGNAIALNLWLSPIAKARLDVTQHQEYSLSDTTKELIRSVQEPLLIRGYLSQRTHPLVAPLVPQIGDLLTEYAIVGGSKIRVELVDPKGDEALEEEAAEQFGITSVPFQFEERRDTAWVNSFFSILVKYGDQHEVLSIQELLEITPDGKGSVDVKLRNLEYDITSTIKKVVFGFQSIDSVFASLPANAEFTAFITPDKLPEDLQKVPARIEAVAKQFQEKSSGKFSYSVVVPETEQEQRDLYRRYGFRPFPVALFSNQGFYLHLLLKVGDRLERVVPADAMKEADIREALNESLRRAAPGYLKKVGIVAPQSQTMPSRMPGQPPQPMPAVQNFENLKRSLQATYTVEDVDLDSGRIDSDVDVLLVAAPENLGESAQRAFDQFVMRGGNAIVLNGRRRLSLGRSLRVVSVKTGLEEVLRTYGVEIADKMVLDERNENLGVPEQVPLGGRMVQRITPIPYPFFIAVGKDGMPDAKVATQGIPSLVMQFASPVFAIKNNDTAQTEGAKTSKDESKESADIDESETNQQWEVLVRSSGDAWLQEGIDIGLKGRHGILKPANIASADQGAFDLVVALTGTFSSHFRSKQKQDNNAKAEDTPKGDTAKRILEQSPPNTRLVVVGSSAFVSDEGLRLAQFAGSQRMQGNLRFIQNLVDWSLADVDLLSIRSRGSYTRILDVERDAEGKWEWINYLIAVLGLFLIAGISFVRRRTLTPIALLPNSMASRSDRGAEESAGEDSVEDKQ